MTIKLTTSCSGVNYSFHQDQVVEAVDPAVGADLVKHGLAVELDADGKPVVVAETIEPVENPDEESEHDATGENSQEDGSTADETEEAMEGEQRNVDEESAETADVDPAGETANLTPTGQTATAKPKGETRKK